MILTNDNKSLLLAFLLLPFIGGIFDFAVRDKPDVYSVYGLVITFMTIGIMFWWYQKDSNKYNYKRSIFLNIMMVAITIIALPYYLVRSRGLKMGALHIILFIILIALYVASSMLGVYVGNNYIQ